MKKDKLIVSNRAALIKKYGSKHKTFLTALNTLQQADKKRNLDTLVVFVDDVKTMKACKGAAVKDPGDARQNKNAIDALYRCFEPDYLLIAGAQDVIPFQPLNNLLFSEDDEDRIIPSDLPYACDAPFHTDPGKFIAPVRVVGRLPDIPGSRDAAYFRSLVKDAASSKPAKVKDYQSYFAVSVHDWRLSTRESLQNIFGHNGALQLSPAMGPKWTKTQLKAKTHFLNCHGSLEDPSYYGQKGKKFPEALQSAGLAEKISPGTIVAAECCYGAQLYDPSVAGTAQMSMAQSYLLHHALAFTGSSTIAYGPAKGQGLADLLTQYFLINTLKGASTGRALLEARQRFLDETGPSLDPYELKTIAQFYLLGDPSLVIVNSAPVARSIDPRQNRRDNLMAKGLALKGFIAVPKEIKNTAAAKAAKAKTSAKMKTRTAAGDVQVTGELLQLTDQLKSLLKSFHGKTNKKTFTSAPSPLTRSAKSFPAPVKFHVYSESSFTGRFKETKVLVVKEKNGVILGHREYVRR
ncbi:hypothetical protein [Chitinophaga cymbidii]|uniref:Gingipain domain-containing protein n=1 Tax=Chitinophaga cymbidii TaxID=1096750 RepID=A0A512RT22_9BACT|nr:hypothetical protein [Chitinophaga cymbidii]GEP98850.1 hypothetical protein CCY01nite_51100 [Chitinophaga cymbidii]